jgi:tetratricopeptide (TPR) repeat protein
MLKPLILVSALLLGATGCEQASDVAHRESPPSGPAPSGTEAALRPKFAPPAAVTARTPESAAEPAGATSLPQPTPLPIASATATSPTSVPTPAPEDSKEPSKRVWTSDDGAFTIEAELLSFDGKIVELRSDDGRQLKVPVARLSAADQEFILREFPVVAGAAVAAGVAGAMPSAPPADYHGAAIAIRVAAAQQRPADSTQQLMLKLQRAAQSCRRAVEALQLYKAYLAASKLPADAKLSLDVEIERWRQLASQRAERFGNDWLDEQKRTAAQQSAAELVNSAMGKVRSSAQADREAARAALKSASDMDPTSTTAGIATGLVYAVAARNYELAHAQLVEALRRKPDDLAALNNLAIVELRLGRRISALSRWQKASRISPFSGVVVHNLQRLLGEVESQVIGVQPQEMTAIQALAKTLQDAEVADPFSHRGWLYLAPLEGSSAREERQADNRLRSNDSADSSESTVVCAEASGFVVAPYHVLVKLREPRLHAEVWISEPAVPLRLRHRGVVTAIDESTRLALVQVDTLRAPPLPLRFDLPGEGTNVGMLGYPEAEVIGQTLTASRGIVLHAPPAGKETLVVCSSATRLGPGAVPVVDASGRLLAVATSFHEIGGWHSFGIPLSRLTGFLSQHIPGFSARTVAGTNSSWEQVDEKAATSCVLVSVAYKPDTDLCTSIPVDKGGDPLEDRFCNTCSGSKTVDCPVRGCANGRVLVMIREITRAPNGAEAYLDRPTRVGCEHCEGGGKVKCPTCESGFDPKL